MMDIIDNSKKRVLVYCRESRDDGGRNFSRIQTQRALLLDFCKRRGYENIVRVIMDDNVSGVDFSRLSGVRRDMQDGLLDVIVFKDASRLGRNQVESLRFIEFAADCGVEIAFESERFDEELFGLSAWFNERRAREDSLKIRRVMLHKMEKGELVIKAPYGYVKEGGALLPSSASQIVKRIFTQYSLGLNAASIARQLTQENIPTPAGKTIWNSGQVLRIIDNEAYTGALICHKRQKKSFKSTKNVPVPEEEWIKTPGHHTAIVSKKLFMAAKKRRKSAGTVRRKQEKYGFNICCGRCGRSMILCKREGKNPWLECGGYHSGGKAACGSHRMPLETLQNAVKDFTFYLINCGDIDWNARKNARKAQLEAELAAADGAIERIYSDSLSGLLPQSALQNQLERFDNKRKALQKALAEQQVNPESGEKNFAAVEKMLQKGLDIDAFAAKCRLFATVLDEADMPGFKRTVIIRVAPLS